MLVAESSSPDLEDRQPNILLNDQVFDMILIIHQSIGLKHPQLSLEGPNNDLVLSGINVVVNIGNADRVMVKLLRLSD